MASFANLSANLGLNIQDFSRNLRTASRQMSRFAADMSGQVTPSISAANRSTTAWGLNLKSVSRVVSGIVISQAFYKILQSVQSATNAVWEFTKQIEYAQIAYSNLFGSTSLAQEFINVLRDYTAKTPFSFTEAEASARRLLAYGIEYKNIMYVMQGVLSTAAAQGDSSRIEQISRAIGQIYTYGKLMTAEVRQLTEAGVPAYEILQEELGLTQEQLRNLGNEAIPASKAINALIEGMQKRFGGVVAAASRTIGGLLNNIYDNATMLASNIFEPLTKVIKSVLAELSDFLMYLRELSEVSGAGGVFEALVPHELQGTLRVLIANFLNLVQAIIRAGVAIGTALKPALYAAVELFNKLLPIITGLINALAGVVVYIMQNEYAIKSLAAMLAGAAAMWVLFRVQALASVAIVGVVNFISKALAGLYHMLTFIIAHPFWALIIGIGGLLVGLSGGFDSLGNKVDSFFKKLTAFNGIDPDKILIPSQEERANDLDKFNNALEDTADSMDNLGDSASGAAAKAKNGLLSFDEVFKLKDPDEGSGSGIDGEGIEDIFKDLIDYTGETFMPEVPDFSEYADELTNGFVDNIKEAFGGRLKEKLISAGIGGLIGAALGSIIGGLPGGKLGLYIGALAGWFWDELGEQFTKTDVGKIGVPIAGALGAAIGWLAGGGSPLGAMLGIGIGSLVGFIADEIAAGFETGDFDYSQIAMGVGSLVGAGIGFAVGGPGGAAIGTAVGALVGWIGGLIADNWSSITKWFDDTSAEISDWFNGIWNEYELWCYDIKKSLGEWLANLVDNIWVTFNKIWQDYELWCEKVKENLGQWLLELLIKIFKWADDLIRDIGTWFNKLYQDYELWCDEVREFLWGWLYDILDKVFNWFEKLKQKIEHWADEREREYSTWLEDTKKALQNWLTELWQKLSTWFTNLAKDVKAWWDKTWNIETWKAGWDSVSKWFTNLWTKISNWFTERTTSIRESWSKLFDISTWKSGWSLIKDWFSTLWTDISGWFTSLTSSVSNWWNNLWSDKDVDVNVRGDFSASGTGNYYGGGDARGHATGGIFNREHIARFAEGDKAEAIIPLENNTAMQPFVDAVSRGIIEGLAPTLLNIGGNGNGANTLPPMYVGTLVADERGLKELYKKFELIQVQENARRGNA